MRVPPKLAFLLVAFCLGQLGDGLNIFQGIYLVGVGWHESSVGTALSLMGLTSLIIQPFAGDYVDKTTIDRRLFLVTASIATAISASTILLVQPGNLSSDHVMMYTSKVIEGLASSFIGPCLAALTLATFGPDYFDEAMASNILWGHVGSVMSAVLAGAVAFVWYPHIQYCFYVIGGSALIAIIFVQSLPQGDPLMGRGFRGKASVAADGNIEENNADKLDADETSKLTQTPSNESDDDEAPVAAAYIDVLCDKKTFILCFTGFFFHFGNANVLLVLGEMMGKSKDGDDNDRMAIPYTAGGIVIAQVVMTITTWIGKYLTSEKHVGRKPLFMAGLVSLPIRCALIILWRNAGAHWLLSTQVLDGIGGGMMGLIQPIIIADITFGTGRFNVVMGLTASVWGIGATLSNFLGQMVVQHFGHVASLSMSLILSFAPIFLFSAMPETFGMRGFGIEKSLASPNAESKGKDSYGTV